MKQSIAIHSDVRRYYVTFVFNKDEQTAFSGVEVSIQCRIELVLDDVRAAFEKEYGVKNVVILNWKEL